MKLALLLDPPLNEMSLVISVKFRRIFEVQIRSISGRISLEITRKIRQLSYTRSILLIVRMNLDPFFSPMKKKWKRGWLRSRSHMVSGTTGRRNWHQMNFRLWSTSLPVSRSGERWRKGGPYCSNTQPCYTNQQSHMSASRSHEGIFEWSLVCG